MSNQLTTFLRYPGSKRRMLAFLSEYLPASKKIAGKFIEPFVGGGAIYFHLQPKNALLADLNPELIDLYRGIAKNPERVWRIYRAYPQGKAAYRRIRAARVDALSLSQRAARTLYLNRTCFKGMWRHNLAGRFNVGYGGESRRWVITRKNLFALSALLSTARLKCCDFEPTIFGASSGDYLFVDPPYRPGAKEQTTEHYAGRQFTFDDHKRLAAALRAADRRNVRWSMTISSHPDILKLYGGFSATTVPRGTGRQIGSLVRNSGEVLIAN
ncbi:MAG: DNA adenine methylase [Candidatus Korobacteraceae bacterium]